MSIGTRAATCASCDKRLTRKHWYYRHGKYYCKKRCWVTEQEKAAKEAAEKSAKAEPAAAAAGQEPAKAPEKPAVGPPANDETKASA